MRAMTSPRSASQNPNTPRHRRSVGDPSAPEADTPPSAGLTSDPGNTPGHPRARGTLPMAKYLTDPAIEDEIQALAAEAPLPTIDQAARLARLLRLGRPRSDAAA
jgi:hypothetical protein